MEYKVHKSENNTVKFTVTLSGKEWQDEINASYNRNKGRYNMPGFRKGKAPRATIEKAYGQGVFKEDAVSEGFYKAYMNILSSEKQLNPVTNPSLNIVELTDDKVVVEATVEVLPEYSVKQYKGFGVKAKAKVVTDKDVDAALQKLVEQNVRLVESKEAIKNGDIANIDFSGSVNGVKFDGGTAKAYDLEIGSKSFIDNFEEQLIGLNVGDTKDVVVTFPKEYHSTELAGKESVFAIVVNAVKTKQYPALDDELASNVSEFNTLAELKADTKKKLEEQAAQQAEYERDSKILDLVLENTDLVVPQSIIEREVDHIIGDFENRLMYQGLTLDAYVNYLGVTHEQFRKERFADAEKNSKLRFAIEKIVETEGLQLTESEVDAKLEEMAKSSKKTLKEFKQTIDDHSMEHINYDILVQKVLKFLNENN